MRISEHGQAMADETVKMTKEDFEVKNGTGVYWLGGGGAMINSRGTVIMIDPLLEGFDMPLLIESPINPKDVPNVDAVLISHVDNDHYSRETCRDLKSVCKEYHTSFYVASLLKEECNIDGIGHDIGDHVQIGDIDVEFTPADHAWQNMVEKYNYRVWEDREYCGFYVTTRDAKIWYVGDSKLLDSQLHMDPPDVMLFDFTAFNGNPQNMIDNVVNPERVIVLAPGEEYQI